MSVPQQFQNPDFRFCLIRARSKAPYELEWQRNGYKFDNAKLQQHIESGGNFGVIGGYGNVRIIDVDTKHPDYLKLAQQLHEALNTFSVETGSGGRHFYILSDYDVNHVFVGGRGELRANNYQVVGPGCVHPNGNKYKVVNDVPIRQVAKEELLTLIKPLIKPLLRTETPTSTTSAKERDNSRSGIEFAEICKLIKKGKTKEEIYAHMQAFAKWGAAPAQYRELTFHKAARAVTNDKPPEVKASQDNAETTTTPYYPTTSHYTSRSWGFYDATTNTLAEQITPQQYLFNADGKLGLAEVKSELDKKGKVTGRSLLIHEKGFNLPVKIWSVSDFYHVPSLEACRAIISGERQIKSLTELLAELERIVSMLFDFPSSKELLLWKLFIVQSFLKPLLDSFFFMAVDATKGSGKTTLLEIGSCVARHGYFGGDVSAASLPRMVEELDLSLFLDELDERLGKGEDDSVAILRKGQRRGSKYVRLNKHTMLPEQFDVAGTHAYAFRGEVEDAIASRSLPTHLAESKDNRLPILNAFKEAFLKPLAEDFFFWALVNVPSLAKQVREERAKLASVVGCSDVVTCSRTSGLDTQALRDKVYLAALEGFSPAEVGVLDGLAGRNSELAFLLLKVARLAEIDLTTIIRAVMVTKAADEAAGSSFYLDDLREYLASLYRLNVSGKTSIELKDSPLILKDGVNAGCYFVPKSTVYAAFCLRLREENVASVGTKKFSALLRDAGFVQGINLVSQRPPGRLPTLCLVFDALIRKSMLELGEVIKVIEPPQAPLWDARALVHLPCKRCGKQPCNFDQERDEPVCFECWLITILPVSEEAIEE